MSLYEVERRTDCPKCGAPMFNVGVEKNRYSTCRDCQDVKLYYPLTPAQELANFTRTLPASVKLRGGAFEIQGQAGQWTLVAVLRRLDFTPHRRPHEVRASIGDRRTCYGIFRRRVGDDILFKHTAIGMITTKPKKKRKTSTSAKDVAAVNGRR